MDFELVGGLVSIWAKKR